MLLFLVLVIAVERWPADVPVYLLAVAVAMPVLYVVPWRTDFRSSGANVSQILKVL